MKVKLHLLVAILIGTSLTAGEEHLEDWNRISADLERELKAASTKTQTGIFNIIAVRRKMEEVKTTDFGLSKNGLMVEIETSLAQNKHKANVDVCEALKRKRVKETLADLVTVFTDQLFVQMRHNHKELVRMQRRLESALKIVNTELEQEIQRCVQHPTTCNLKHGYPQLIIDSERRTASIEGSTAHLIENIINIFVRPLLNRKVAEDVYESVKECISCL